MNLRGMALLIAFICLGLVSGCATGPKIDWESRIGNYTYDQAVLELGPPDKIAELSDGSRVAEWLTYRGRSGSSGGGFFYGRRYVHVMPDPGSPDAFIRLSFDKEGRLAGHKRVLK
ncbi:MAG: hypothetical protein SFY81_01550 [Verrucomicrobiota bacterium]|nr:hypothetical protein [Verrucomicrobiota bacterium]